MNILTKLTILVKKWQKEVFLAFCIILIVFIGYNLGKLNALSKTPISVTGGQADVFSASESIPKPQNTIDRRVVVSKNSDKYHFTWCSGAKRIKEENKIWFENEALAQAAGYSRAGNCN